MLICMCMMNMFFVNLQKYGALNGSKKFCFALKSHLRTEVV